MRKVVAGGTNLYVQQWDELIETDIDLLSSRKDLRGISLTENEIIIGSATTILEIEESDLINKTLPELKNFLKLFGSKQIRNRATIGGNIVNASPITDLVNILLVLDSTLLIEKSQCLWKLN